MKRKYNNYSVRPIASSDRGLSTALSDELSLLVKVYKSCIDACPVEMTVTFSFSSNSLAQLSEIKTESNVRHKESRLQCQYALDRVPVCVLREWHKWLIILDALWECSEKKQN